MPRLLMIYGTTDGHTAKVARFFADELRARGAAVDVVEAGAASPDSSDYAGVVVAASLHARGYQRKVLRWVRANVEGLRDRPSVFLSVCLSVLQRDLKVQRDLVGITNHFEDATGWRPFRIKFVAGALPYTRYGWLKRMVMQRIVRKAGGSTDTSRDHEYTDWNELRAFAAAFYAMCRVSVRHRDAGAPPAPLARAG
jgi:menaquinone-dependent protoporphyrinogen oxidase